MEAFSDHGMIGAWLIGAEEIEQALDVLHSRSLFRHYGPALRHKAKHFEGEIARTLGIEYALGVNSGTSALRCALAALKLAPGDEVIVPPCTFAATANAVVLGGGIPVFAEIDESLGLDPDSLSQRITPRTVGIIAVHLQGVACRIDALVSVAERRGLWVVEDCAQALGVSYAGRSVGSFGAISAFSLQAHKTITCGEGGIVVTRDEALYRRARRFQDQGGERLGDDYPSWEHPDSGFGENLKIGELQAAVALAQLAKLDQLRTSMVNVHGKLGERIDLRGRERRAVPQACEALPYSYVFYARDLADREALMARLSNLGVPADRLYHQPLYASGPFVRWSRGDDVFGLPSRAFRPTFEPCPRSDQLMTRIVRIPLSPMYTDDVIERLAGCVNLALADCDASPRRDP